MKIKPKYTNTVKTELTISDIANELLKSYAEYTRYTTSEIVDKMILEEVPKDDDFIEYIKKKRYAKKIQNKIGFIVNNLQSEDDNSLPYGYAEDEWEQQKAYIESIYEELDDDDEQNK